MSGRRQASHHRRVPAGHGLELYGGTEALFTMVSPGEWLQKPGTVGRAGPGITVTILDDDGAELGPGEVGTVYACRSQASRIAARRKRPRNEWRGDLFTLGEMGHLDEDGYLFLHDRKKDMIVTGGSNVYSAEVEAVLITHPAVADVAVIGVPDPEFGEHVAAIVETMAPVSAEDLVGVLPRAPRALQVPAEHRVRRRAAARPERQGPEARAPSPLPRRVTMPKYAIRLGRPDDVGVLRELFWRSSFSNEGDRAAMLANREAIVFDESALREQRTRVALGDDGRIVGFSTVRRLVADVAELEDLFVDPECMRRGVGTQLVRVHWRRPPALAPSRGSRSPRTNMLATSTRRWVSSSTVSLRPGSPPR